MLSRDISFFFAYRISLDNHYKARAKSHMDEGQLSVCMCVRTVGMQDGIGEYSSVSESVCLFVYECVCFV